MALYHQVKRPMEIQSVIREHYGSTNVKYGWVFLMKARKIRLDYSYYKSLKEEIDKLIHLL